jgi:hypothetical protein
MKNMVAVLNTLGDRKQLDRLIPSPAALRMFDALARKLGTSRQAVAAAIGSKGEILIWAFARGTSPRAEEIRQLALAELDRLINEQTAVAA